MGGKVESLDWDRDLKVQRAVQQDPSIAEGLGGIACCTPMGHLCVCFPVLRQISGGYNSKTQNGLLSPPQEEKLTNSQTSLCEILQEKGRWAGVSLDQSALLPLRLKNIREKTDAHFVDVIKEDR